MHFNEHFAEVCLYTSTYIQQTGRHAVAVDSLCNKSWIQPVKQEAQLAL